MNDLTNDSKEPSIPEGLNIQVVGIEEDLAYEIGRTVLTAVREYSRLLPLESLDAITIAADYKQALANVDRGFPCRPGAANPTEDEVLGVGAAMALPVLRNGDWKTHIVFGPTIVGMLRKKETEGLNSTLNLIAHELGHAVDHYFKCQAFGSIFQVKVEELIPDPLQRYLWEWSHHIWDEYFANRICSYLTSGWSHDNDLFLDVCGSYRDKVWESRIKYHHREISLIHFLEVAKHYVRLALMATGYLLGRNDGLEGKPSKVAEATELLHRPESKELLAFHAPLLKLWENNGNWPSYDDFLILNEPTQELLKGLELYPSLLENGSLYMDVPVRGESPLVP